MIITHNKNKFQVRPLFTEVQIRTRIVELAVEIQQNLPADQLLSVVVVLHGAFIFAADLVRAFALPTEIFSVRLKSYEGTQSSGHISLESSMPNLSGKHVLIVEDIIDTGASIKFLKNHILQQNPESLHTVSLLHKPGVYPPELAPDYAGFGIGKNFVIGYGLDLDGRYRNLPYVGELVATTS
jgi:hypoxanthine phosphoribosyltransferase